MVKFSTTIIMKGCVCVCPPFPSTPKQKFLILFIETLTRNISRLWCNASQWDFRPWGGYSSCLCSLGPVHKQDQHLLQFRPHNTSKYLHWYPKSLSTRNWGSRRPSPCLMLPIPCNRTPFYSQQMNLRPKTFGRAQIAYLTTAEAANNAETPSRPTGQSSSHRQAQARLSPTSLASKPRGLGPSQSLRPQLFPVSSNLKIIQMNISKKRLYELASTPATSFHTAKQKFHKGGFLKRCSSA